MVMKAEDKCLSRRGRQGSWQTACLQEKRALSSSRSEPQFLAVKCGVLYFSEMRNEEEALFGSSDDFFRLRQSPWVQMVAWPLSQAWRSTQDGSLVTGVRVRVEFHISHCWKGSVFHPLFILKALFSPSLCVLTGGGKRMNSVFPMVHWSLGPGSFNLKSQKWWFPQEQMAPIASLAAAYLCLLHHSILKSGVLWN